MASFFQKKVKPLTPKYIIMRNGNSELTLGLDCSLPVTHLRQLLDERLSDLSENEQFIHSNGAPIHILDEPETLINELLKNSNVIHLHKKSGPMPAKQQHATASKSLSSELVAARTEQPPDTVTWTTETEKKVVPISETLSQDCMVLNPEELSQSDMQRLLSALKQNKHVKQLIIVSDCDHIITLLIEVLAVNQNLTGLTIWGMSSSMNDINCTLIANALITNHRIEKLDLASNNITSRGCIAIGEMLKSNQKLRFLRICRNPLGDEGVKFICEAMLINKTLHGLDLYQTEMSSSGVIPIVKMLRKNQSLTWLDIGDNDLGDRGIIVIANVLRENNTLLELCTKSNQITKKGAVALADMLETNRSLQKINLHYNNLSEGEKKEIHEKASRLVTIGRDFCTIA